MAQVDKFMWDVGTWPRGWKPGDQLRVNNANYRAGPFVEFVRVVPFADIDFAAPVDPESIYSIRFHRDAREKVLIWLRKFATSENYATISKQII